MLRRTAFTPKRAHGRDIGLEALLLGAVGARGKLDERVQRDLHPGALFLRHVHVVGVDAPQHGLMGHDDDVLAAFEFHDDGLESDDDVAVGFPAQVTVIVLVVVARFKIFRVPVRNLLIGQAVAQTRVQFVQGFPFKFVIAFGRRGEEPSGLDRAFQGGGPNCELAVVTDGGSDKVGKCTSVQFAAFGNVGVSANFASQIEFGFAMLAEC